MQNKVKLTVAFDATVHAAMTSLAHDRRRSFTAEVQTACDEHLARAGVTPTAPVTIPITNETE